MKILHVLPLIVIIILLSGCTTTQTGNEITDGSLAKVLTRGELLVGVDAPYGLMEFINEEGEIDGLDIDIVKEIAEGMGVELKVTDYDWEEMFEAVKSGEVDVAIASITITTERQEDMLFSDPYFNAGQILVIRTNDDSIKILEDLAGKKVGAQKETTSLEEAEKYALEAVPYDGYGEDSGDILGDLKDGTIDAIIIDYVASKDLVKDEPEIKILGEPFTQEFYGIPTKLGNNALIEEINNILRDMKREGKLKEIENAWLE